MFIEPSGNVNNRKVNLFPVCNHGDRSHHPLKAKHALIKRPRHKQRTNSNSFLSGLLTLLRPGRGEPSLNESYLLAGAPQADSSSYTFDIRSADYVGRLETADKNKLQVGHVCVGRYLRRQVLTP